MHRSLDEIKADPTLTEEQIAFIKLVASHDLTYDYSDDFRVWKSGNAQLNQIKEQAKKFDFEFVVEVWNASVDCKIVPTSRETFYWKV